MRTQQDLRLLQALPLDDKIMRTKQRIREWVRYYGEDGVCVSFSGGKDSTVLLHLVRSLYPNVRAVFSDTGLEYPEIRNFVKTFDNVDWIKPKMTFGEIVTKYGYPLFSKEISNTIWYARKIRGGGEHNPLSTGGNGKTRSTPPPEQINCRRKKLQGNLAQAGRTSIPQTSGGEDSNTLFRGASGRREQVNLQQGEILACLPRTSLFNRVELLFDYEKTSYAYISARNGKKTVCRDACRRKYAPNARMVENWVQCV